MIPSTRSTKFKIDRPVDPDLFPDVIVQDRGTLGLFAYVLNKDRNRLLNYCKLEPVTYNTREGEGGWSL